MTFVKHKFMKEYINIHLNSFYFNHLKVKKFKEANSKWKKNLLMMKEKQKDNAEQKLQQRAESLKIKKRVYSQVIKEREEKLIHEDKEHKQKIKNNLENIKLNNRMKLKRIDNERKQTEARLMGKHSKFSKSRLNQLEATKTMYHSKTTKSLDHLKYQWKVLSDKEIEKSETLKERAFSKFASFVT